MLEHLQGRVESVTADAAVISLGGVGLRVQMPTGDLAGLSGEVTLHTVMQIRDDEVHLYGFTTDRARELFKALMKVTGVGPKVALAILSFHAPDALERAIASGDHGAMSLVPGIGKKKAQRIVLELRDSLGVPEVGESPATGAAAEVREALKGLGYTAPEISKAMASLPADGDAPTLLRHAMRALGGREPAGADA
ncbi:MAG TPA: Holliday junction branch migration protein RuvA [Actinomycetota bacterium]|nr:Holliday junction branch migration protein RuvA [Actinomycetota bacterium]